MKPPAGVRLRRLEKRFGDVVALHPLDLDVAPGELVVLVGPSGCGKTTALRLVAGLEGPTGGEVHIGDRDVTAVEPAERDVAMVFQHYALYPHMTVRENLAFGLRMRGTPAAERERRVARAAEVLGLDALLGRRPGELSGGQKQRVAFGRAMVREPQVFLFDEPLSNLDARLRADLRREIADLHARLGATMIYVTHDQVEAMTLGQRIAVMKDGRLQQCATPLEIYRRPATLYVAGFVGTPAINTAAARLDGDTLTAGRVRLALPAYGRAGLGGLPSGPPSEGAGFRERPAGDPPSGGAGLHGRPAGDAGASRIATLAVRPEGLALGPVEGADLTTRVQRVEQLGNEALVYVDGPHDAAWVVRAPSMVEARAGDTVGVRIDRATTLFFDDEGRRIDADASAGAA